MMNAGYLDGIKNYQSKRNYEVKVSNKEDKTMVGTQVQVVDFEFNGVRYTNTRPNYYYKKVEGKQVRISKAEYDEAWEKSGEAERAAERAAREAEQAKKDRETEKNFNKQKKSERKPRRSKDVAFELNGVTLTAKQVRFLQRMPEDDFFENGLESALWIDVYCDTIANEFNPMAVGAMVSTLREKGLVYVVSDRVNGKKCKSMAFTDLGKQVAKELGLH